MTSMQIHLPKADQHEDQTDSTGLALLLKAPITEKQLIATLESVNPKECSDANAHWSFSSKLRKPYFYLPKGKRGDIAYLPEINTAACEVTVSISVWAGDATRGPLEFVEAAYILNSGPKFRVYERVK